MIKNTNLCVDLKTVMQHDALMVEGQAYNGVLTRDGEDHYRFEEAVRHTPTYRNLKLYEGKYISLTHRRNGKYHCYMRGITPTPDLDRGALALRVYAELVEALGII